MKSISLLIALLLTNNAFAHCVGSTLENKFMTADVIIVATAINTLNLSTLDKPTCAPIGNSTESICPLPLGPMVDLVSIDEVLKGNVQLNKKAFILQDNSAESVSMKKGKQYLLFATRVGAELYTTHGCAGSTDAETAAAKIAAIRTMAPTKQK